MIAALEPTLVAVERGAAAVVSLAGVALVHGTVLALLAALLAATVLRRARPAVHAALWTIVLLKFVVPIGPGARFSLASLAAGLGSAPAPEVVMSFAPPTAAAPAPVVVPAAPRHRLALAAVAVWALVAIGLGARQLRRYRRARARALAGAPAPRWLLAELAPLAARIGVRRRVTVRVADERAPYMIGLVRPVVVVPRALVPAPAHGDADDRRPVESVDDRHRRQAALAHELAHVRRADGAVRILQLVAATLFFFWPVVRWVNRRLDLAREQACDAYAIAVGPLAPAAYARMLVNVARERLPAATLALGGSQLARRVDVLVRTRRAGRAGIGAGGAAAVTAFALVGLTGAASARAQPTAAAPRVCIFTPEVAASILASYPEADSDGDGALTRNEVCDFQLALRRRYVAESWRAGEPLFADAALVGADLGDRELDPAMRDQLANGVPMSLLSGDLIDEASPLASDQLCCNCSDAAGPPAELNLNPAIATCLTGVDP